MTKGPGDEAALPACWHPGGAISLYIFWVRGRTIGKDIDFHDIRNGIDFRDLGIKNK